MRAHETRAKSAEAQTPAAYKRRRSRNSASPATPASKTSTQPRLSSTLKPKITKATASTPAKHAKASTPYAVWHPQAGADGQPFQIDHPCTPSEPSTWHDPDTVALFVPNGATPPSLNGIALTPWTDPPRTDEAWEAVDGQMPNLDEPVLYASDKAPAAGVIIEEPDGRIWVVRPSNAFAGYVATWPKGHADEDMSLQATAIKEAFEETGLKVAITGFIADLERSQTVTRYYRARRVGGTPAKMGWETQGVALVPKVKLGAYLNRELDRKLLKPAFGDVSPSKRTKRAKVVAAQNLASITPAATRSSTRSAPIIPSADAWTQVGKQVGSNPGGVFRDENGRNWYLKSPKTAAIARNEVLAANLYQLAGVRVPNMKLVTRSGKFAVASAIIPKLRADKDALTSGKVPGVYEGFAADAWLANWDVVGLLYDNLLLDADNRAVRVDTGGALAYRAQGRPKGAAFGARVTELQSLVVGKNATATAVFGKIPPNAIRDGIRRIVAIPDATIHALCQSDGPGSRDQRTRLADKLIKRKQDLQSRLSNLRG